MGLRKNFLYNTIYQVFVMILPMITVPYISRVLGTNGVGAYAYTSSYAQYFVLIGMIGIALYGNRQIAYTKNDRQKMSVEFWNIYTLQVITTVLAFIAYIVIFVIINDNNKMLYFAQSITILAAVFDISWFFIGYEDMKSVVVRNTITKIIGVVLIFALVNDSEDVIVYTLIMSITMFVGQIIMWFGLKGKVDKIKPTKDIFIGHLKPSLSLFVSQLAIQIYVLLDRTMLGLMTNDAQVGLYDNSQKTIKLVLTLVTSLGTVMLPRMSSLYSEGKIKEFKNMIYKAFSFINFLAFPMTLGLIAIADNFSVWFYGEGFDGIQILLKAGSLIIIAISWSNVLGLQVMLPMKKEREFTISVTIGAVINLILNFILITKFNSLGTTIASVLAEISVTLVQIYFLRKLINIKLMLRTGYKPVIGSIIMFIGVVIVNSILPVGIIYTLLECLVGVTIYFFIMYLLKDNMLHYVLNEVQKKIRR